MKKAKVAITSYLAFCIIIKLKFASSSPALTMKIVAKLFLSSKILPALVINSRLLLKNS